MSVVVVQPNWIDIARDFSITCGKNYHADDVSNPDFCFKEINRLGYSLSVIYITKIGLDRLRTELNLPPSDWISGYVFQLKGPLYPMRGDHNSPLLGSLAQIAASALYHALRLLEPEWKDQLDSR